MNFIDKWKAVSSISGWFSQESCAIWDCMLRFQEAEKIGGDRLEIGVYKGRSAVMLAENCAQQNLKVFLVEKNAVQYGPEIIQNIRKIDPTLREEDVHLIPSLSRDILDRPEIATRRAKFAFIHVDGEHTGSALYHDLEVADSLLSEDGLVVVDDFLHQAYPQLAEAVYRYLFTCPYRFVLFLSAFNKGYLARPKYVHRYINYVTGALIDDLELRGSALALHKKSPPADCATYGLNKRASDGRRFFGPDYDIDCRYT